MAIFLDELIKAMAERNFTRKALIENSKLLYKHRAVIPSIFRGTIPRNVGFIDELARVLGKDPRKFRLYALLDTIDRDREFYELQWDELNSGYKQGHIKKETIPIYNFTELINCLSEKGYPEKPAEQNLAVSLDYGSFAYGIYMDASILSPKIELGEIAFASGAAKKNTPALGPIYGIVRSGNELLCGKIIEDPSLVIIETLPPNYTIHRVKVKDALFIHHIRGMYWPRK